MVTESGDLIILAVQRQGGRIVGASDATLEAGDTLLLQGTWKALDIHLDDPDVLVVNSPELVRRQAVPMGRGREAGDRHPASRWSLLLATGSCRRPSPGLLAAGALILLGHPDRRAVLSRRSTGRR